MKVIHTGRLLLAAVLFSIATAGAAEYNPRQNYYPLIFFSSEENPNDDQRLRAQLKLRPGDTISYGENILQSYRVLIIHTETDALTPTFDTTRQLFTFIARNTKFGHETNTVYNSQFYHLFYTRQPLVTSCGPVSTLIRFMFTNVFKMPQHYFRRVVLYDTTALTPSAVQEGYLEGGHAVEEVYLPDLGKWVVFDGDKGIIPMHNGNPLSMPEIAALPETAVAFSPVGLDRYGKGPASATDTNAYYREARQCFGIYGNPTHILYTGPVEQGEVFKRNFERAYSVEAVIHNDPEAFAQRFYRR